MHSKTDRGEINKRHWETVAFLWLTGLTTLDLDYTIQSNNWSASKNGSGVLLTVVALAKKQKKH